MPVKALCAVAAASLALRAFGGEPKRDADGSGPRNEKPRPGAQAPREAGAGAEESPQFGPPAGEARGSPAAGAPLVKIPRPARTAESQVEGGRRRDGPLGIGLRVSYLLPAGADVSSYAGAFSLGATYTLAPRQSRTSYELGLDFAGSDEKAGPSSSTLVFLRAAALYRPLPRGGPLYLLGGVSLLFESVAGEEEASNSAAAIDLGLGGRFGAFDARVAYLVCVGTLNVKGTLALSVGYTF